MRFDTSSVTINLVLNETYTIKLMFSQYLSWGGGGGGTPSLSTNDFILRMWSGTEFV